MGVCLVLEVWCGVAWLEVEEVSFACGFVPSGPVLHICFAGLRVGAAEAEEDGLGSGVGEVLVEKDFGSRQVDGGQDLRRARGVGGLIFDGAGPGDVV